MSHNVYFPLIFSLCLFCRFAGKALMLINAAKVGRIY
nr:MAG TPA: hypothetical protein [Caudoviricetes sp.]